MPSDTDDLKQYKNLDMSETWLRLLETKVLILCNTTRYMSLCKDCTWCCCNTSIPPAPQWLLLKMLGHKSILTWQDKVMSLVTDCACSVAPGSLRARWVLPGDCVEKLPLLTSGWWCEGRLLARSYQPRPPHWSPHWTLEKENSFTWHLDKIDIKTVRQNTMPSFTWDRRKPCVRKLKVPKRVYVKTYTPLEFLE